MAWMKLKDSYYASLKEAPEARADAPNAVAMDLVERLKRASATVADQETRDVLGLYIKRRILKDPVDLTSTITADICDDCGVQMMVIANDSMLACSRCAKTRVITSANAWTSAMDVDFSNVNSHQKSRLLEWLEFAQAKEYGEIPNDVLQAVNEALITTKATGLEAYIKVIADERAKNGPFTDGPQAVARLSAAIPDIESRLKHIDAIAVRNVVRNLTLVKKYAERSPKIAALLSGYWPERMSADQEEYVRKLFMAASPVYDRWRRTSQPVWPGGYAYFLRTLMILLGWDEFAALFPIQLTGRNQEREDMRQVIWSTLRWSCVPSSGPQSPVTLPDGTTLDGSLITVADKRCKVTARGYDELC